MTHFKKAALSLAIASSIALVGCSGSSSSGGGDPVTMDPSSQSVSGTAVKGVLKSARVTVYELDDSGDRIGEVGTATTNDDGEYEADLNDSYQGGLLEIEVTSVPGQTRMVCDASACGTVKKGDDFELPDGFKLSAIAVKDEGSDKVSAPVTAWSTMATNRAKQLVREGKTVQEASRRASDEVSLVAGFDVSRTTAKDINNLDGATEEEAQAAAMNAVIAEAVFTGGKSDASDFVERLESISKVLDDGALNDGDGELKTALADATVKVSKDPEIQLSETVRKELDSVASQVNEGIDVSNSTDGELSFRGFVSQVRAWANSIESVNSDDLSAAIKADSETIKNIFSASTEGHFAFLGHVLDAANEFVLNNPGDVSTLINNGGSQEVTILDDDELSIGSATLTFSDVDGLNISITGTAGAGEVFQPVNLQMDTNIPVDHLDVVAHPDRDGSINLLISNLQEENSIALSGTIGTDLIILHNLSVNLTMLESISSDKTGGFMEDAEGVEAMFATAELAGEVTIKSPEGDRFEGAMELAVTRLKDIDRPYSELNFTRISPESFRISGAFDSSDPEVGSFEASAALNIRNGAEFDVLSWGEYSSQSRWLPLTASEAELAFMKQPAPDNAVFGFVRGGYDAETHSQWGYGQYYVDDGSTLINSLNLGEENLGVIFEDVKASVLEKLAALDGRFVLEPYYDSEVAQEALPEFAPEELVSLPLTGGWLRQDPLNEAGNLGLSFSIEEIPGLESASLVFIDASDQKRYVGNYDTYVDGESTLYFDASYNGSEAWISGGAELIGSPNPLIEVGVEDYVTVQGATYQGYSIDADTWSGEMNYWGSIDYEVPVSINRFDACTASAVSELEVLTGRSYPDLSEKDVLSMCARNTLAGFQIEDVSYESGVQSVDFSQLQQVGRGIFEGALGDFAAEVDTRSFTAELTFGSAASGLEESAMIDVLADFPNLETADYFLNGSITVSADVELAELPRARATVTLDRTAQKGGSVLANVIWNGGNYTARVESANFEDLEGSQVVAEFSNAEGHVLQLVPTFDAEKNLIGLTGKALSDGDQVGKVALRDTPAGKMPVIEYDSGSETVVETLF